MDADERILMDVENNAPGELTSFVENEGCSRWMEPSIKEGQEPEDWLLEALDRFEEDDAIEQELSERRTQTPPRNTPAALNVVG